MEELSRSQMYGVNIQQHTTGINFSQSTPEDIVEYVRELSKDKIAYSGPFATDDLGKILDTAGFVLHVKVEEFESRTDATFFDVEFYKCTVVESLKGGFEKDDKVTVVFFTGTVKPGDEYIVTLSKYGSPEQLSFVTSNSLYEVSRKKEMKELLAQNS